MRADRTNGRTGRLLAILPFRAKRMKRGTMKHHAILYREAENSIKITLKYRRRHDEHWPSWLGQRGSGQVQQ